MFPHFVVSELGWAWFHSGNENRPLSPCFWQRPSASSDYRPAKSVWFMAWSGLKSQLEVAGVIRNAKLLTGRNPLSDMGRHTHTNKDWEGARIRLNLPPPQLEMRHDRMSRLFDNQRSLKEWGPALWLWAHLHMNGYWLPSSILTTTHTATCMLELELQVIISSLPRLQTGVQSFAVSGPSLVSCHQQSFK